MKSFSDDELVAMLDALHAVTDCIFAMSAQEKIETELEIRSLDNIDFDEEDCISCKL